MNNHHVFSQQIYNQLIEFGLDNTEAKIYLHLLEVGPRTPLRLSREVNLNRSKIYRYIDKMQARSLIIETNDTWGKKIKAANPQNLQLLLAKKETELKRDLELAPSLINSLLNFPANSKSSFEIKHYKGVEGLKQMLWNRLSAHEFFLFGYSDMNEIVGKNFAEKVRTTHVERNVMQYELENVHDRGKYWYTNVADWNRHYDSYYISPKLLKIRHYLSIFNDTVSLMNWEKGEHVGIEIVDKQFAQMQKQIFSYFWKIAKKNHKNKE